MITRAHLLFDLDGTLVDTESVICILRNSHGRKYLPGHIDDFCTRLYDSDLLRIVRDYKKHGKVTIVTNSPKDYAEALLQKHGFPSLPLVSAANKPAGGILRNLDMPRTLVIGDSAKDILWAHQLKVASIAVKWGYGSTEEKLLCAEPSKILTRPEQLEDMIKSFESGEFSYTKRRDPKNHQFIEGTLIPDPDITIVHAGNYVPWNRCERDEFSGFILNYKAVNRYTQEEIKNGCHRKYFWNGCLRRGAELKGTIRRAGEMVIREMGDLGLDDVVMLGAPNSLPEYCYAFDTNRCISKGVSRNLNGGQHTKHRLLRRIYPKLADHNNGRSSRSVHYETIGMRRVRMPTSRNMVIFDDITTSGTQLTVLAQIVRYFGYGGNIYGIALGKTA